MAGPLSDKDREFLAFGKKTKRSLREMMPGPLSDKDIQFMRRAAPKVRKRKFVPGEIYSAKGKKGRN
jgi:hypothetical protein|tara:strand:+ start:403 stop:603 length:201 start_codon:yes stop_codon:yes gene_type:complete